VSSARVLPRILIASLVVLLLALGARVLPGARARSLPTPSSQWIWKDLDWDDHQPAAFSAVRDFDLPTPPASLDHARLLVTADEEYVLTLNGRRIGAGAYTPGAPLDVYEVGPLLLPGGNRLAVELRSSRGAGGLLASLVDGATGRLLVGTDESWRIFPRHELGLSRGWLPVKGGQPATCWGYPPVGRWGRPRPGPARPLLGELTGAPVPPATTIPLPPVLPVETGRPPGSPILYDWGREVTGYLTLEVAPSDKRGIALLFTGDRPPDPLRSQSDGSVLIQPGRHEWMDARPRRFRYAVILGLLRPATLALLPVPSTSVALAVPPPRRDGTEKGVLGILAPPLRTPVEDEVWGKLQRVSGIARRKER
jgi:hypothetical protein